MNRHKPFLLFFLPALFLLGSCASLHPEASYRSPDVVLFHANRVLVLGMTRQMDYRMHYETAMRDALRARGVDAVRSIDLFDLSFSGSEQSETDLDRMEARLLDRDFDAILLTKLTPQEEEEVASLKGTLQELGKTYDRFRDDYLVHQGIFYNQEAPEGQKSYWVETSLYCICVGKARDLLWRSRVRLRHPRKAGKAIDHYVDWMMGALEREQLILGLPGHGG
jgi:hypothetical protein